MLSKNSITVIDDTISPLDIVIIKSLTAYLGFELINETGEPIYIEVKFGKHADTFETIVTKLTIRK